MLRYGFLIGEVVPTSSSPFPYINAVNYRGRDNRLVVPSTLRSKTQIVDAKSLIDCRADGVFMHPRFVQKNRLDMIPLEEPLECKTVDGTPIKMGPIKDLVRMQMTTQGRTHMQDFLITDIGEHDIILSMSWLDEQNPLINWKEKTLSWDWAWEIPVEPDEGARCLKWIKMVNCDKTEEVELKKRVPSEYHEWLSMFSEEAAS